MRKRAWGVLWLLVCALALAGNAAAGGAVLWQANTAEIKWYKVTALGSLVVGTDDAITCYDGESGKVQWQRTDLRKVGEFQVEEIAGTPVLLVGDTEGSSKAKLYALDIQTGKAIWESEKMKGSAVAIITVYEKNMVVLVTSKDARAAKDKVDMTAFNMATGAALWESEFPNKVDLHAVEGAGRFIINYDLSGHQPPVYDGDSLYFTYAGLHRFDINTGKLVWGVPYDVTEGKLKRGNAQAVIAGDIVYTSAKGVVRAIEKSSGAVKWMSKDFGAAVAEMIVDGNRVYGRMGGSFYDWEKREWELKKPLGVVAVHSVNGSTVWRYDDAKDSITNMVLLPELNSVLIADSQNLIGLDTTIEGNNVKESFKLKLEFKHKIGAGGKAARAGLRFARGGLIGMAKGDKSDQDPPVAIMHRENGLAIIRGKQHILAFEPKSKSIPWSMQYPAPGVGGWQKIVMGAITAASYAYNTGVAMNTRLGTTENNWANENRRDAISGYMNLINKRYSATSASQDFVYVLTNVEDGKDTKPGLVAVNLKTGAADREIILNDKEVDYKVDELTGRVFQVKDKKEIVVLSMN